jgi:tetratricopeptide (TPR) repeat protein
LELGRCQWLAGRSAEAEARLNTYVSRHPDSAEAWLLLGLTRMADGRWEVAQEALGKVAAGPDRRRAALAFFHLGLAAHALGDGPRAREAWQECVGRAPGSAYAMTALGLVLTPEEMRRREQLADAGGGDAAQGDATEVEGWLDAVDTLQDTWRKLSRLKSLSATREAAALADWLKGAAAAGSMERLPASLREGLEKAEQRALVGSEAARGLLQKALRQAEEDAQRARERQAEARRLGKTAPADAEGQRAFARVGILRAMVEVLSSIPR